MSRPVHLFGCGHPMLFALASFLGCDVFDSASYAKFASRDSLMFTWGTRNLKELDKIAYIRFASVYTNFKEVGEFGEYIEELDGKSKK